jgi:beta-glucosidase/6-phospho-beta-glucosidase/beta-galactosidase
MTLNQTIQRLQSLALAHAQVKSFYFGDVLNWLASGEKQYPAIIVDLQQSVIAPKDFQTKHSFEVWFMDLVNVSENALGNEQELMSDLLQIAEDYAAMIQSHSFQQDWTVNDSYGVQFFREHGEEVTEAVKMVIEISTDYPADRCQIPSDNSNLFTE